MLDADGVELDVHTTRDGGFVVHHDPEVPGFGPIAQMSLSEARQVRIPNGETLPLLPRSSSWSATAGSGSR